MVESQLDEVLPTDKGRLLKVGSGRPRVTQLESLSDSFLFGKLSEEFNLSSGGSGSDADQQAR